MDVDFATKPIYKHFTYSFLLIIHLILQAQKIGLNCFPFTRSFVNEVSKIYCNGYYRIVGKSLFKLYLFCPISITINAINTIKNNGLDKIVERSVIRIAPTQKLAQEAAARKQLKQAKELEVDPITITRTLSYAKAQEIERIIKQSARCPAVQKKSLDILGR